MKISFQSKQRLLKYCYWGCFKKVFEKIHLACHSAAIEKSPLFVPLRCHSERKRRISAVYLSLSHLFKKEILRPYGLRMTGKGRMINIRKRTTLFVILSEAKNLIPLLNFSPDVWEYFKKFYKFIFFLPILETVKLYDLLF